MTDIDAASGRPVATTNTHILYALHAVSPFSLWSLSLLAVIMGAFVRDSVRGTYVETHLSWLLRTFCWTLLWAVILIVPTILMVATILLIPVAYLLWLLLGVWYVYRVIRGWLRLNDHLPAPD
jgi:uncharacterized membrane protein